MEKARWETDGIQDSISGRQGRDVEKSPVIAEVFWCHVGGGSHAVSGTDTEKVLGCKASLLGLCNRRERVTERCSDDGEPSGTAGKPILEVIRGAGLHNIFVVVTRYFGGTLLGTGGLVRAYTESAREGISHSQIITKIYGFKLNLTTDYTGLGKIQYLLGQRGLTILDSVYTEKVDLTVLIPKEEESKLIAEITEATNGQTGITRTGECWFANVDGEMVVFE